MATTTKIRKKFPIIRYPSSLVQQNHGENLLGHGFSLWDLKTKTYEHHEILNDYGFYTAEINNGKLVTELADIPKKARVQLRCINSIESEIKDAVSLIKSVAEVDEISYRKLEPELDAIQSKANTLIKISDINEVSYQNKLLSGFLKNNCKITDEAIIASVLEINTKLNTKVDIDASAINITWKPKRFEFSNMFSYGEDNVIDFSKAQDVMGIFGPNACGKSSIFSALSFCIFDKFDRGYKASDILNAKKTDFYCKFNFEINNIDFFIERTGTSNKKGEVKVLVKFWKVGNGITTPLNGDARQKTNEIIKEYVGSYDDFILTAFSVQSGKNVSSFVDMGQSKRKDLISQFIGLVIFDKLLELATAEAKGITSELKIYQQRDQTVEQQNAIAELETVTSIVAEDSNKVTQLTVNRDQLNEDLIDQVKLLIPVTAKSVDITQLNSVIAHKQTELAKTQPSVEKLTGTATAWEDKLAKIEGDLDKFTAKHIIEEYQQYQKKVTAHLKLQHTFDLKKVDVQAKLKKLEMLKKHEYDPNCKYCVNSVFVQDAKAIEVDLKQDKLDVKQLLNNKNELQKAVNTLEWVVDDYKQYNSLVLDRDNCNKALYQLTSDIKSETNKQTTLTREIEIIQADITAYNTQIDNIKSNTGVQHKIDGIKQDIQNVNFNISQLNKKLIESGGRMASLKTEINRLTTLIANIKILEKQQQAYSLYLKAVNRDGLPYMVINNTLPVIEREVNAILNQMVDFQVIFDMDGTDVTPNIVYQNHKWTIEMASGFEKFISSLAIRVALTNISNLPRPNFLIVDEGWGTMDTDNLAMIETLLSFLKTSFDFVIVVSHIDVMRDMVDHLIEIKKDGGFSSVNFV